MVEPGTRTPYRLIPLSECVLYKLYEAHVHDDANDRYSIDDICAMFNEHVPRKLVLSAIDLLRGRRYEDQKKVNRHGNAGAYSYSITHDGIMTVERALNRRDSVAAYLFSRQDARLEDVAGFGGIFYTPTERADLESWSPLEIDRESDAFKETLQTLEESYETIRGDNGFATELPAQRAGILASIEQGLDWLRSKEPSARQLTYMLLRPLPWSHRTSARR
jgi:hypothetical protein